VRPHISLPAVALAFSDLINAAVLSDQDLARTVFDCYFSDVLVHRDRAAFSALAGTLPAMLASVEPRSSEHKQLADYCDSLVAEPSSLDAFQLYCAGLRARARLPAPANVRADFVAKAIRDFFSVDGGIDSSRVPEYLAEWTTLLRQFVPLERALELIAQLYVGRVRRFLPAFVELAKVVAHVRKNNVDEEVIAKALGGIEIMDDVQGEAIAMLTRGGAVAEIVREIAIGSGNVRKRLSRASDPALRSGPPSLRS
jgi:hypothetical protein